MLASQRSLARKRYLKDGGNSCPKAIQYVGSGWREWGDVGFGRFADDCTIGSGTGCASCDGDQSISFTAIFEARADTVNDAQLKIQPVISECEQNPSPRNIFANRFSSDDPETTQKTFFIQHRVVFTGHGTEGSRSSAVI